MASASALLALRMQMRQKRYVAPACFCKTGGLEAPLPPVRHRFCSASASWHRFFKSMPVHPPTSAVRELPPRWHTLRLLRSPSASSHAPHHANSRRKHPNVGPCPRTRGTLQRPVPPQPIPCLGPAEKAGFSVCSWGAMHRRMSDPTTRVRCTGFSNLEVDKQGRAACNRCRTGMLSAEIYRFTMHSAIEEKYGCHCVTEQPGVVAQGSLPA